MIKPHKFEASFSDILLSEERVKNGTVESIIKFSGVGRDASAVDFGCGPGFLTIPLAKKIRMVYSVDINGRMLEILAARLKKEKRANVTLIKSREYSVSVPDNVDYVFAMSLIHEVVRKRKILEVFHGLLAKKGKLVIADWRTDPKSLDFGPSLRERISKIDMIENAAGLFKLKKEKLLDNQYYLLFEKV